MTTILTQGAVQIEQDILLCKHKYPELICRPIAAQFIQSNKIAIFEFTLEDGHVKKVNEKQYLLVDQSEISDDELQKYNNAWH